MEKLISEVDNLLKTADLPTYTEFIKTLKDLVIDVGFSKKVDTHAVFKAWSLLDRVYPELRGVKNADYEKY
jgi:hypothetical protein